MTTCQAKETIASVRVLRQERVYSGTYRKIHVAGAYIIASRKMVGDYLLERGKAENNKQYAR